MNHPYFSLKVNVHVFFFQAGQVLLLRRFNTGYADGKYSVVAGHLDGDETVIEAAIREAKEEAGVTLTADDLEVAGVMHRKANNERIDFFFKASSWQGEIINNEPHKCDDLSWAALDALPSNTLPYIHQALQNIQQGRWFDLHGWENLPANPQETR